MIILIIADLLNGDVLLIILFIAYYTSWWFQIFFIFHFIYRMSSFPLTNSYFSEG